MRICPKVSIGEKQELGTQGSPSTGGYITPGRAGCQRMLPQTLPLIPYCAERICHTLPLIFSPLWGLHTHLRIIPDR